MPHFFLLLDKKPSKALFYSRKAITNLSPGRQDVAYLLRCHPQNIGSDLNLELWMTLGIRWCQILGSL